VALRFVKGMERFLDAWSSKPTAGIWLNLAGLNDDPGALYMIEKLSSEEEVVEMARTSAYGLVVLELRLVLGTKVVS